MRKGTMLSDENSSNDDNMEELDTSQMIDTQEDEGEGYDDNEMYRSNVIDIAADENGDEVDEDDGVNKDW